MSFEEQMLNEATIPTLQHCLNPISIIKKSDVQHIINLVQEKFDLDDEAANNNDESSDEGFKQEDEPFIREDSSNNEVCILNESNNDETDLNIHLDQEVEQKSELNNELNQESFLNKSTRLIETKTYRENSNVFNKTAIYENDLEKDTNYDNDGSNEKDNLNKSQDLEDKEDAQSSRDETDDEEDPHELNEFIENAKEFGANALDLSQKNLTKIPKKLFELCDLQYIYLEGNKLTKLPKSFFEKFSKLKWLDLRNNNLKELPTQGLGQHESLRYLLLENNQIKRLPYEIANLRQLTALNLIENPIVYPPMEIVQKGTKSVQEFLRDELYRISETHDDNRIQAVNDDDEYYNDIKMLNDDVWASDDESNKAPKSHKTRLTSASSSKNMSQSSSTYNDPNAQYLKSFDNRIKSATRNILVARSLRPTDAEFQNLDLKERLSKAKLVANRISKSANKLLSKRKMQSQSELNLFKNKEYENACKNQSIESYKKKQEKIDTKLQKVKDRNVLDDFKNDLKAQQRKLLNKRMIKGVDYADPALKAPFDVNQEHLVVMTNEEREVLDRKLANLRMQPLSSETLLRIEEERRIRDHELQEKIREYTNKLLVSRNNRNLNPKLDRIQASRDIKELKRIERELEQRRRELQFSMNPSVGNQLVYRETAKLNAKAANVSNFLSKRNF